MCIRDRNRTHLQLLDSVHVALLDNVLQTINEYAHGILKRVYQKQILKLRTLKHEQIKEYTIICKHKFYTRVSNLIHIQLNSDEIDIFNKGLNNNIAYVNKDQIIREIINAEAAI